MEEAARKALERGDDHSLVGLCRGRQGELVSDSSEVSSPEKVLYRRHRQPQGYPLPGTWLILVDGFEIDTGTDKFELRVSLDGQVIK